MTWSSFETLFLLFIAYSFLGSIVQAVYVQIENATKHRNLTSKAFLHLPLIPIYGFGSIIILTIIDNLLPPQPHIFLVFLISMFACTTLELITGELLKLIFKKNFWWDYSDKKFNFDGQICLINAFLFGLGGVIIYYVIQPAIISLGESLTDYARNFLFWAFLILLIIDFIHSSIKNWKHSRHPKIELNFESLEKQYRELEEKLGQLKNEYQETLETISQKAFPSKK